MFEKFNERGRQVVVLAQDESRALGQPWIGTDHLLLGLIREGGEASTALEAAGLTLERARNAVTALVGRGGQPLTRGQIPFTLEAKQALEGSLRESGRLHAGAITPSLVLLGVLRVGTGSAACVLRDCDVDHEVVIAGLEMADRIDSRLYRQSEDAKPEKTHAEVEWSSSHVSCTDDAFFARFTERARQVVVLAQDEARALRHNYVGTEHILLGLLCEEEGLPARVLNSLGITVEVVSGQVAQIVGRGDQEPSAPIPFTPLTKKVLELALREALSLGHNYIGTEHILLGLVRENEGVASRILLDFDVDAEKIRDEVIRMLSGPGRRGAGPASTMFAVREETLDPAARSMTVGELIDSITAAKDAAINDQDFQRAAEFRDMERKLRFILRNLTDPVTRGGDAPQAGDDAPVS